MCHFFCYLTLNRTNRVCLIAASVSKIILWTKLVWIVIYYSSFFLLILHQYVSSHLFIINRKHFFFNAAKVAHVGKKTSGIAWQTLRRRYMVDSECEKKKKTRNNNIRTLWWNWILFNEKETVIAARNWLLESVTSTFHVKWNTVQSDSVECIQWVHFEAIFQDFIL